MKRYWCVEELGRPISCVSEAEKHLEQLYKVAKRQETCVIVMQVAEAEDYSGFTKTCFQIGELVLTVLSSILVIRQANTSASIPAQGI